MVHLQRVRRAHPVGRQLAELHVHRDRAGARERRPEGPRRRFAGHGRRRCDRRAAHLAGVLDQGRRHGQRPRRLRHRGRQEPDLRHPVLQPGRHQRTGVEGVRLRQRPEGGRHVQGGDRLGSLDHGRAQGARHLPVHVRIHRRQSGDGRPQPRERDLHRLSGLLQGRTRPAKRRPEHPRLESARPGRDV